MTSSSLTKSPTAALCVFMDVYLDCLVCVLCVCAGKMLWTHGLKDTKVGLVSMYVCVCIWGVWTVEDGYDQVFTIWVHVWVHRVGKREGVLLTDMNHTQEGDILNTST